MPIVSSLVLPHGATIFDGGPGCSASAAKRDSDLPSTLKESCQTLFKACQEAAEMAKSTRNPDVIFLNTPHGVCLHKAHCVYLNSRAKGNAEWNGQWTEYDVDVALDTKVSGALVEHLLKDGIPVEGMRAFAACEAPLRWGEVIPLWFFRDLTAAGVKVVIFSNPVRRMDDYPLSEVTHVGRSIANFLSSLEQRVLYIVSGDLAHSHKTDCTLPLYLPDPRWNMPTSDTALPFDLYVENWVKCSPLPVPGIGEREVSGPVVTKEKYSTVWDNNTCSIAEQWLAKGTELKCLALTCGIYGFGVLHGILSAEVERMATFDAHLLCRLAPTYYGMMVAAFIKRERRE